MTRRLERAIALGFALGLLGTMGCGQREPVAETPSTGAAAPEQTPTPPPTAPETTPSISPTPTAQPPVGETPINPPQAATLTAQQKDSQINLRSQPSTSSESKGYGLVGDPVKLMKAAAGKDGITWYYVKFDTSGAEGWIRGDFINTNGTATTATATAPSIDAFTTDELFAAGSGGCGMTLIPANGQGFVFFNGGAGEGMIMKLDGKLTRFRRTTGSGKEFYGQFSTQSFQSEDGATQVDVTVTPGDQAGAEVMKIDAGTLRLKRGNATKELSVKGDAGC